MCAICMFAEGLPNASSRVASIFTAPQDWFVPVLITAPATTTTESVVPGTMPPTQVVVFDQPLATTLETTVPADAEKAKMESKSIRNMPCG